MRHLTPTSCAPQHFLESTFKNLPGPENQIQYSTGPDERTILYFLTLSSLFESCFVNHNF